MQAYSYTQNISRNAQSASLPKHGAALPPALIVQGTSSSAGKSLLVAALCRLLKREGLNVAPFKAQNMSLNSWVTIDGREMGIAQALQARACGLCPDARMNPILLKPMGEKGSQIILLGKPVGAMPYSEYIKIKPRVWEAVKGAYASLSAGRDIMVIEGAGSPAEINLREHDIVNMAMAHHAGAAVLLVADIDRGGAFASLAGTMALLDSADQSLIAGFILNKFRGDKSLLAPALREIEKRCQRPFFGVIPMIPNLRLPEEDSATLGARQARPVANALDVAIINLAGISNIADWDALAREPDIQTRLVNRASELGEPDLVILPGSRTVAAALAGLRTSGLDKALQNYADGCAAKGRGNLVGVCAGLQILGQSIEDPHGIEAGGRQEGLALLPLACRFGPLKILAWRKGRINLGDAWQACSGYEIHHGRITELAACGHPLIGENGEALAYGANSGAICRVWGAWLHGIFDNDGFRNAFLSRLRREAGLPERAPTRYDPDAELDRLADIVGENLDLAAILALAQKNEKARGESFQDSARRDSG